MYQTSFPYPSHLNNLLLSFLIYKICFTKFKTSWFRYPLLGSIFYFCLSGSFPIIIFFSRFWGKWLKLAKCKCEELSLDPQNLHKRPSGTSDRDQVDPAVWHFYYILMLLNLSIKLVLNQRGELATSWPNLTTEALEDWGERDTGSSRADFSSLTPDPLTESGIFLLQLLYNSFQLQPILGPRLHRHLGSKHLQRQPPTTAGSAFRICITL